MCGAKIISHIPHKNDVIAVPHVVAMKFYTPETRATRETGDKISTSTQHLSPETQHAITMSKYAIKQALSS